jgi:hypothetical protein
VNTRLLSRAALGLTLTLALCASAGAAAAIAPKPHATYLGLEFGHFSITLDTSGRRLLAGPTGPLLTAHAVSGALAVCPASAPGEPVRELHVGFPGATLRKSGTRYTFKSSYTENHAHLVVVAGQATTTVSGIRVSITGTVASAQAITGTIAITAPNCNLTARKYRAKFFATLPG